MIPQLLCSFVDAVARKTGWAIYFWAGGPDDKGNPACIRSVSVFGCSSHIRITYISSPEEKSGMIRQIATPSSF